MSLGDRITRWWAHRKLGGGQCRNCREVLRDDQREFCSEDCAQDWRSKVAW